MKTGELPKGGDTVQERGGPVAFEVISVGVVDENELLALGLRACLADHPLLRVTTRADEPLDVAVVSPRVAEEQSFGCPLVVCGDPPAGLAPGNVVLALLPPGALTAGQLVASVQAAAAGLRVGRPDDPSDDSREIQDRRDSRRPRNPDRSKAPDKRVPERRVIANGGSRSRPNGGSEQVSSVSVEAALKAIADSQRRRILSLVRDGELSAGIIATHFDVSRPAISQHLHTLKEAGLLRERREGTRRLYRVRQEGLAPVEAFLDALLPERPSLEDPLAGVARRIPAGTSSGSS
ncbi:MAG: ArsR/SmtB family transcription factor [Acidimicrobiia bacterium]